MYSLDKPFVQKGRLDSSRRAEAFREIIAKEAEVFRWRPPPRAGISVSAAFFGWRYGHPRATRLAKFHLDLMKAILFRDDAQVVCLEVLLFPGDGDREAACFHIERMATVRRRRRLLGLARHAWLLEDLDFDEFDSLHLNSIKARQAMLRFQSWASQHSTGSDEQYDSNLAPKLDNVGRMMLQAQYLVELSKEWRDLQVQNIPSAILEVEHLNARLLLESEHVPGLSSREVVRREILRATESVLNRLPTMAGLQVPYEADIEVRHPSFGVPKDLDNAATDVLAGLHASPLAQGDKLHGLRIQSRSDETPLLRARLLPSGTLRFLQRWESAALEHLRESLPPP